MKLTEWIRLLKKTTDVNIKEIKVSEPVKEVFAKNNNVDKVFKIKWANGSQTIPITEVNAIKKINDWMNRSGWQWLKVINIQTGKYQIFKEPTGQYRSLFHVSKLNESLYEKK